MANESSEFILFHLIHTPLLLSVCDPSANTQELERYGGQSVFVHFFFLALFGRSWNRVLPLHTHGTLPCALFSGSFTPAPERQLWWSGFLSQLGLAMHCFFFFSSSPPPFSLSIAEICGRLLWRVVQGLDFTIILLSSFCRALILSPQLQKLPLHHQRSLFFSSFFGGEGLKLIQLQAGVWMQRPLQQQQEALHGGRFAKRIRPIRPVPPLLLAYVQLERSPPCAGCDPGLYTLAVWQHLHCARLLRGTVPAWANCESSQLTAGARAERVSLQKMQREQRQPPGDLPDVEESGTGNTCLMLGAWQRLHLQLLDGRGVAWSFIDTSCSARLPARSKGGSRPWGRQQKNRPCKPLPAWESQEPCWCTRELGISC